jgi:uncharacterized membrane protein YgcG
MNMKQDDKLDPRLAALLDEIKPASARDPQAAARARSRFLAQAVSASEERRHNWWTTIFQQKEKFAMNLIMSALVVLGLLFGGSATVSAAQDDLPTQPLYQIKLASEDARVWFTSDPIMKIEILMKQAQTRTEEMAALASAGVTPPIELITRTQDRIQQALQLTATLDNASMAAALEQIRAHLQSQEQLMIQLQDGTCTGCDPILQQTREMLRTQLGQVESDLVDPGTFRNQNQHQNQVQTTQTPVATDSLVIPQTSCTPALDGTGQQNGNNNPTAGTPMPQNNGTNQNNNENGNGNGSGGENMNNNGNSNGGGSMNDNINGNGSATAPGGQGGKP